MGGRVPSVGTPVGMSPVVVGVLLGPASGDDAACSAGSPPHPATSTAIATAAPSLLMPARIPGRLLWQSLQTITDFHRRSAHLPQRKLSSETPGSLRAARLGRRRSCSTRSPTRLLSPCQPQISAANPRSWIRLTRSTTGRSSPRGVPVATRRSRSRHGDACRVGEPSGRYLGTMEGMDRDLEARAYLPAWRDPLSAGWRAHRGLLLLRLRWHERRAAAVDQTDPH